jgi:branched-chain amino acid transport system substrate-binding protein
MRFIKFHFQLSFILFLAVFFLSPVIAAQDNKEAGGMIKIGLLIPDSKSLAAKYGAELAIIRANERGGVNGLPLRLIVRSMEGPWGTGSKQAVTMIFDENVIAVMGSHDGRNAHLVEQVTAKSRVVFLSAWASDPTLSQAFVPWFFSCVPNDLQQTDALIEEIYNRRNAGRIAVIYDTGYDSGSALKTFLKKLESKDKPEPMLLTYDTAKPDLKDILNELKRSEIKYLVLFVQPPASLKITEQLKLNHINILVFGSLAQLNENLISRQDLKNYENTMFVSSEYLCGKLGDSFSEDYRKTYGNLPGAVAAYAWDGMNILIEAVRKSGPDRDKVQKSMAEIKYEGATGIIDFDDKGNRKGTPGFVEVKNGIQVHVNR